MNTSKKLLFIAIAIVALMIPATVIAYTTVWNQLVTEVTVREPIQVTSTSAISVNQTIWPGQELVYEYKITNLAPKTYQIEISGVLNHWRNGHAEAWCGTSAPTVTVILSVRNVTTGEIIASSEGRVKIWIPPKNTVDLIVLLWFHEDVEAGNWSYYLNVRRLPIEGKG